MLRSLFPGTTGLKSHQTRMDVIGNNIVNVNTYGFKPSRTTLRGVHYQTTSSSTSASDTRSGSNASQVGYGILVVLVDIPNTHIGYVVTGNLMDLYIDGEGYFVVQDGNGNECLTQAGTLGSDGDGSLTGDNGNPACGYSVDKLKSTASAGDVEANFDLTFPTNSMKNGSYTIDGENTSYIEGYTFKVVDGGASTTEGVRLDPTQKIITIALQVTSMTRGRLQDMLQMGIRQVTGETSIGLSSAIKDSNGNALKQADGTADLWWADVLKLTQIKVDGVTDTPTKDDVVKTTTGKIAEEATFEGSGSGSAVLRKIIDSKGGVRNIATSMGGMITGEDVDGTIQIIGKIVIADVPSPDALQYEGNSYYKAASSTGVITYTTPGESNTDVLRSGDLEISNVDLANEFFDMIITQRGFQISPKTATVSDEILETLVDLKRQLKVAAVFEPGSVQGRWSHIKEGCTLWQN